MQEGGAFFHGQRKERRLANAGNYQEYNSVAELPSTGHRRHMSAQASWSLDPAEKIVRAKRDKNTAESRTERASYRVIERAKGGPENPEIPDR